jgi:exosortase/archaeosortase family protein
MTQVTSTVTARPHQVASELRKLCDQARLWWSDAHPTTRTAVQVSTLIAVTVIAYSYSLTTLVQLADLNSPLAYVSLVPLLALILAAVNRRPSQPEPSIHDRQTDYIIGVPLMLSALFVNFFLPTKLSAMFWVWRIDLLTMPLFVAGAVAVIFGVRVLWRQKIAVAFLFLAWTYPYTSVLLGLLNAFTSATLFGLTEVLRVVHVATPTGGVGNTLFLVNHNGHRFELSVISACSGVSSVVGFFLVGTAFAAVIRGPLIRKVIWLVGGMALLWGLNLFRLVLVFWAGQHFGEHFAISVLHPYIGLFLFAVGVAIMILFISPMGLRIKNEDDVRSAADVEPAALQETTARSRRHSLPVPHVYLAVTLVLVIAILLGVSNVGLQTYNLVADVSGGPKVLSFINDPVTPVGWTSRYEATFQWAAPLFGEQSTWNRYELYPGVGGDLRAHTDVIADVIDTPDLQSFAAFGVEQCYQFHGYTLNNVTQVSLPGGITGQALAYNSQQFGSWTIVYWILPVKRGATNVYERVVLYVQNAHGVVTAATQSGQAGIQSHADGQGANPQQLVQLQNEGFLVAYAREMINDQANQSSAVFAKHSVA